MPGSSGDRRRATATRPVQDQFYGDRAGTLVDPFGHTWSLATHQEDVSVEEMKNALRRSPRSKAGCGSG